MSWLLGGLKGEAWEKGECDVNDHSAQHVLRSMPGVFTALNLICIMYVGFKQIQPEID